jgi:hypothetical protein
MNIQFKVTSQSEKGSFESSGVVDSNALISGKVPAEIEALVLAQMTVQLEKINAEKINP